jgi:acyl-CoA synthetase (NDP forming)
MTSAATPLILRDGTTALVRASRPADAPALEALLERLRRQQGADNPLLGRLHAEMTLEEMFDVALLLSSQPLPRGGRVANLSNAGGPAILCADACEAQGLEIAELSDAARAALADFLPEEASTRNPVDMIASASAAHYRRAAQILLEADEVDSLVVIYAPIDAAQVAPIEDALHAVLDAGVRTKPVVTCLMGEGGRGHWRGLRRGLPRYVFPEDAARVLGRRYVVRGLAGRTGGQRAAA